jgi:peptidoglycan/xylan/chitin deacetylase (PgdA/CDA1 family)
MKPLVLLAVLVHAALGAILLGIPALTAFVLAACLLFHAAMAWGVVHPRSRLFGPNRSRLDGPDPVVALTFDDGPHPDVTPRLLDLLKARGVRATFFVIGREAARHPDIVRRIAAEGHALGNHTQRHSYLFWALGPAALRREIEQAQQAIATASGVRCRLFRAPVGLKSPFEGRVLAALGLDLVSWEARFLDRAASPARLRRRLRRVRPGSIILLHDGADRSAEGNPALLDLLPGLLDVIQARGLRCAALR